MITRALRPLKDIPNNKIRIGAFAPLRDTPLSRETQIIGCRVPVLILCLKYQLVFTLRTVLIKFIKKAAAVLLKADPLAVQVAAECSYRGYQILYLKCYLLRLA